MKCCITIFHTSHTTSHHGSQSNATSNRSLTTKPSKGIPGNLRLSFCLAVNHMSPAQLPVMNNHRHYSLNTEPSILSRAPEKSHMIGSWLSEQASDWLIPVHTKLTQWPTFTRQTTQNEMRPPTNTVSSEYLNVLLHCEHFERSVWRVTDVWRVWVVIKQNKLLCVWTLLRLQVGTYLQCFTY